MKPFLHANASANKYGGCPEDYQDIHDFIDDTKKCHGDIRHRALLHNTWGCFLVERIFGVKRINSEGKHYSPRDIAEEHIIQDLGHIPTVSKWLDKMPIEPWMSKPRKTRRVMHLDKAFTNAD